MASQNKAKLHAWHVEHFVDGYPVKREPADPVSAQDQYPKEQDEASQSESLNPSLGPKFPPKRKRLKIVIDPLNDNKPEELLELREVSVSLPTSGAVSNSLDTLALAAENKKLKEDVAKLTQEKEELIHAHQRSYEAKVVNHVCTSFRQNMKYTDFKYYTGFTYAQFQMIFQFLFPDEKPLNLEFTNTVIGLNGISLKDQLLLVLMKLKQAYDFRHLSNLFMISPQDCSTTFSKWINFMHFEFGSVSIWPHRSILQNQMPCKFRQEFPNTFVVIGVTELKTQRPSVTRQSQLDPDYNSSTPLKGLVGVDPRGSVMFISKLFSGAISDAEITERSGFLSVLKEKVQCGKLRQGDGVLADKLFNIEKEISATGLRLNIPPVVPREGQMSVSGVSETGSVAADRLVAENAIRRVKNFKLVSQKIDSSLLTSVDQIWFVCCFLTNFMAYLVPDNKKV